MQFDDITSGRPCRLPCDGVIRGCFSSPLKLGLFCVYVLRVGLRFTDIYRFTLCAFIYQQNTPEAHYTYTCTPPYTDTHTHTHARTPIISCQGLVCIVKKHLLNPSLSRSRSLSLSCQQKVLKSLMFPHSLLAQLIQTSECDFSSSDAGLDTIINKLDQARG